RRTKSSRTCVSVCSPKAADKSHTPETGRARKRCLAMALLLVAAAGCATQRGAGLPEFDDWDSRRDALSSLSEWEFHGRIGVSAGDDGFNGKLRWWQHDDVFVASVSGPLGVGTVKIQGDERQVSVTDEDGVVTEMQDAEA